MLTSAVKRRELIDFTIFFPKVHIRVTYFYTPGASPGFGRGGAKNFFFQICDFACREATCCIARGVRGHAPPRKFFKTVQFGAF